MFEKRRKRRGSASAFGLALVAMLAFGALAAGSAQAASWHVDGEEFSDKEYVEWDAGPIQLTHHEVSSITCEGASGEGWIYEGDRSAAQLTLYGCVHDLNPEGCQVKDDPIVTFYGELVEKDGRFYEQLNVHAKWGIKNIYFCLENDYYESGSAVSEVGIADLVKSPRDFEGFISGEAEVSLLGLEGSYFGASGLMPATWTVGGQPFGGQEGFSNEGSWIELERASGGAQMGCGAEVSGEIYGGDRSYTQLSLSNCKVLGAPECTVSNTTLKMDGQVMRDAGGWFYERNELSGSWTIWGKGCPVSKGGAQAVSGSLGAYVEPNSLPLRRYFWSGIFDPEVHATGLQLGGETWNVQSEVDMTLDSEEELSVAEGS